MKKIAKLFAGLFIFAGILTLSGCAFDWTQTYNTWYKYNKASGLDIPIVDIAYADADADATIPSASSKIMENAEFYVKFNPDKGLTIAIQSSKDQSITLAGGLLETTATVVTGGSKTYDKKDFGKVKWITLYGTGLFTESSTPKVISDPDSCIILASDDPNGENKFDFQWKKVLRTILIQKLLGEV